MGLGLWPPSELEVEQEVWEWEQTGLSDWLGSKGYSMIPAGSQGECGVFGEKRQGGNGLLTWACQEFTKPTISAQWGNYFFD